MSDYAAPAVRLLALRAETQDLLAQGRLPGVRGKIRSNPLTASELLLLHWIGYLIDRGQLYWADSLGVDRQSLDRNVETLALLQDPSAEVLKEAERRKGSRERFGGRVKCFALGEVSTPPPRESLEESPEESPKESPEESPEESPPALLIEENENEIENEKEVEDSGPNGPSSPPTPQKGKGLRTPENLALIRGAWNPARPSNWGRLDRLSPNRWTVIEGIVGELGGLDQFLAEVPRVLAFASKDPFWSDPKRSFAFENFMGHGKRTEKGHFLAFLEQLPPRTLDAVLPCASSDPDLRIVLWHEHRQEWLLRDSDATPEEVLAAQLRLIENGLAPETAIPL